MDFALAEAGGGQKGEGEDKKGAVALERLRMFEKASCRYWPLNLNGDRNRPMNQTVTAWRDGGVSAPRRPIKRNASRRAWQKSARQAGNWLCETPVGIFLQYPSTKQRSTLRFNAMQWMWKWTEEETSKQQNWARKRKRQWTGHSQITLGNRLCEVSAACHMHSKPRGVAITSRRSHIGIIKGNNNNNSPTSATFSVLTHHYDDLLWYFLQIHKENIGRTLIRTCKKFC